MPTTTLIHRPAISVNGHRTFSIDVRDGVCRCGHGRSVHRLLGPDVVGSCSACDSTQATGNLTPTGNCCHGFAE